MMFGITTARSSSGTGWSAARLDYVGDTTSMIVVVPDAGTFDTFEQGLTAETLAPILAAAVSDGDIVLPRFKFKTATDLKAPLVALGMTDAFGAAPTSPASTARRISWSRPSSTRRHRRRRKGDHRVGRHRRHPSAPPRFPSRCGVDRPFLFFIVHQPTGAVLFQGRVLDPSK